MAHRRRPPARTVARTDPTDPTGEPAGTGRGPARRPRHPEQTLDRRPDDDSRTRHLLQRLRLATALAAALVFLTGGTRGGSTAT